jgi:hypothetical protein
MAKIYKYMGSDVLELSLARNGYIGFKCSLPKDYNDPYELFLSIDHALDPQLLAFYQESISEIPQIPTTCFSRSPVVVPMWAHYAHTSSGFVIEIDEEILLSHFNSISIDDIIYADIPNKEITPTLQTAYHTCKPRHTFLLHKLLIGSAYFSKQTCWSYEQERRILVPASLMDENMIFYVPLDCVTSIIVGTKAQSVYFEKAQKAAEKIGCELFQSFVGKSYPSLYMKDKNGTVCIFNNREIIKSIKSCSICGEPLSGNTEFDEGCQCSWCAINETHRRNAAESNPYRLLQAVGLLEKHVQGMENIYQNIRSNKYDK